jgi:hypothetical protein
VEIGLSAKVIGWNVVNVVKRKKPQKKTFKMHTTTQILMDMKLEYEEFLTELCEKKRRQYAPSCQERLTRADLVRAECNQFTREFVMKFPHLTRVPGFYGRVIGDYHGTEHWWCVEPDGTIVDPTAAQFQPGHTYTPLDENKHTIKIGRCMNCGDDIFGLKAQGPKSICSKECEHALEDYYESDRRSSNRSL